MKKLIFGAFSLFFFAQTQAQQVTDFPLDKVRFVTAIDDFMKKTNLDNCIKVNEEFQELVKNNAFDVQQYDEMVEVSNALLKRKCSPNPYFVNFFSAVNAAAKNKVPTAQFVDYTSFVTKVCNSAPKGDNKGIAKLLDFGKAFFTQNAIDLGTANTWKFESTVYKLTLENNVAKVVFGKGNLKEYNRDFSDSAVIENTIGDYYIFTNTWQGKGGLLTWTKAGLDPKVVYANILKDYSISLDNSAFTIDTVEFWHKGYFPYAFFGKYIDKIGSGDTTHLTYPRFESDGKPITIKDIAPQVDYEGGFGVKGNRVIGFGTPESKASIVMYKDKAKTQKLMEARFTDFSYTKDIELSSTNAEVLLFNGKDTIWHPELIFSYKIPKRTLRLERSNNAVSKSKFLDTYHNIEFDVDQIFWNLDSQRMEMKILSGAGQVGALYESKNFFAKWRMQQIQGVAPYEPLAIIYKLSEKQGGSKTLNTNDVAKAWDPNLPESSALTLIFELVQGGFITYNSKEHTITIREKLTHFVLANAKRRDYDNIRLKSVVKDGTDYFDLRTNELDLKGVQEVPISDTSQTYFFPKNGNLIMQKNRDMVFGGKIYAGRNDFFGPDFEFKYDTFKVELNTIDSMRIGIPDGDRVDENGREMLKTLKTNIDKIKGRLLIDLPINKSGRASLLQFPKLISMDKSYAYYSDNAIANGAYKRDYFYFELDTFTFDSLAHFDVNGVAFKGKLVSGGIFLDMRQELRIQNDLSLGFSASSPAEGWDLYRFQGKFKGDITLDYRGVTGGGEITHLTSRFKSSNINFYLDTLKATADTFAIARAEDGPKTPEITNTNVDVFWKTKQDSMFVNMKDSPFKMYQNQTELKGNLMLASTGLRGNGTLDWKDATISSKDFDLKTDELFADTAAMQIKSEFSDRVTFKTPNVYAHVNFKTHKADFKSNVPEMPTTFDYNQYKTNIREFKWDIDNKFLDFNVPAGEKGEYFESINPSQLGLKYRSKRATYDLKTSVLTIQQIEYIPIADSRVYPDSETVIIREAAAMDRLTNAKITADTIHKELEIENCTLDIISAVELKGEGTLLYSCEGFEKQPVYFPDITTKKEDMNDGKGNIFTDYSLIASGKIAKDSSLHLYPFLNYYGDVSLYARNPKLYFNGFGKFEFKNPNAVTAEFNLVDDIGSKKVYFHYDSVEQNPEGEKLGAGLYFNKSSDESQVPYTSLFAPLKDVNDEVMFHPVGVVTQPNPGEYRFADEAFTNKDLDYGNSMLYDDNKGIVTGEGAMKCPAQFSIMKTAMAGTFRHDLNKNQVTMNVTLAIDMRSDKNTEEKFASLMYNEGIDLPDATYPNAKFKQTFHALADPKADKGILEDYVITQMFKRPKALDHYLVLSGINFIYDSIDNTFRSYGRFAVSFIGDATIHKMVSGYIEMGPRNSGADFFNIYISLGAGKWFYFNFKNKTLGLLSSYEDFNYVVDMLPGDKRIVGKDKASYKYTMAAGSDKDYFFDNMKEKPSVPGYVEPVYRPKVTPKDSTNKAGTGAIAPKTGTGGATGTTVAPAGGTKTPAAPTGTGTSPATTPAAPKTTTGKP